MKLHSTNAFIIYEKKMNEADLLLSYITEDYGKITCFANNARKSRKRFLGKLEPAMLTRVKFYEKPGMSLAILYEVETLEDYGNIRKDIDVYLFLTKITEIARVLCQEGDNNRNVFNLIRSLFTGLNSIGCGTAGNAGNISGNLESGSNGVYSLLLKYEIYFISNLLKHNGIFPNFNGCIACGESNGNDKFRFSLKRGGVICDRCVSLDGRSSEDASVRNIPVNFINLSRLMAGSDISIIKKLIINDSILKECSGFLENFLSYHTGKKLRSFDSLHR